ncbi:MAG: hypothetical protein ACRCZ9_07260 [Fusobacteriaceae bacterium]
MKRYLLIFVLLFASCGKSIPELRKEKYMDVPVTQTGFGRTVWISSVEVAGENKASFNSTFGESFLKTMVQDELYKSGFEVLERAEMNNVVEEHIFSQSMTSLPLVPNMISAKYTVSMKLINIQASTNGVFLPLIYVNTNQEIESSVEVKLIDNITGLVKTRSGHAVVTKNNKNILLFFGDLSTSLNGTIEFSIRSSIRDALSKF